MIIAIDGPSGAGKSTVSKSVAKAVARELGFSCLDTGAMYRSIAWYALEHGVSLEDSAALGEIARERAISFSHEPGNPAPKQVFIDGVDVTGDIRTARIDRSVSSASKHPEVREALVDQQRRIGSQGDYVVEVLARSYSLGPKSRCSSPQATKNARAVAWRKTKPVALGPSISMRCSPTL